VLLGGGGHRRPLPTSILAGAARSATGSAGGSGGGLSGGGSAGNGGNPPYSDVPPPPPPPLPWGARRLRSAMEVLASDKASQSKAHAAECIGRELWARVVASLRRRLARSPAGTDGGPELAALLPEELSWHMAVLRDKLSPLEALCDDADVLAKDRRAADAAEAKAAAAKTTRLALAAFAAGKLLEPPLPLPRSESRANAARGGRAGARELNGGYGEVAAAVLGDQLLAADKWGFHTVKFGGGGRNSSSGGCSSSCGGSVGGFGATVSALTPIEEVEAAARLAAEAEAAAVEAAEEAARQAKREAIEARSERVAAALYPLAVAHAAADSEFKAELVRARKLRACSDMERPHEWYPAARLMKRKIVYHGGPTNSGKTYHALQALRGADPAAGGGVFCGPLRLLALEVYEALNHDGIYCSLLTGQVRPSTVDCHRAHAAQRKAKQKKQPPLLSRNTIKCFKMCEVVSPLPDIVGCGPGAQGGRVRAPRELHHRDGQR